jgi:hypothetical protein
MPLYVFQLYRSDGVSPALVVHDLALDEEVLLRAKAVLDQHRTCDHVSVWRDNDFVLRLDRNQGGASRRPHLRPVPRTGT